MTLQEFGFDGWFSGQVDPLGDAGLAPVRVIAVHKGECEVSDGATSCPAKTTGRLRHRASSKLDMPTVGDWVLVDGFCGEGVCRIEKILGRKNELKRKSAGRTTRHQLIAANIDAAFIMQALGPGYNLRRLERYLVMVNESGIEPIVLLSKSDLLDEGELRQRIDEACARLPGVQMHVFSNTEETGLAKVMELFVPGKTYCVIGSSGVGKTSLLNNLLGEDLLFTLPVRDSDGKGLHSTTWRELVVLDNGAMVVDTPGMRELGQMDVDAGIGETFDDIRELAGSCRFGDCSHVDTPGCAVLAAVEQGELSEARYGNYLRLMGEVAFQRRSELEKREQDRKLGRFYRSMKKKSQQIKGRE